MFSYTCGLRYVHAKNLFVIHIWSGKLALIQGEFLGKEIDMQSSEPTQTSQKQDACGSKIFICDSDLQSFIFSGTQVAFCHKSLYSLTCLCRRMNLWGSPSAQGGSCTSPSTVPSCMQPAGITKGESKTRIRHTENRNNFIKTWKSKEIEVIFPHAVSYSSRLVP